MATSPSGSATTTARSGEAHHGTRLALTQAYLTAGIALPEQVALDDGTPPEPSPAEELRKLSLNFIAAIKTPEPSFFVPERPPSWRPKQRDQRRLSRDQRHRGR